MTDPDDTAETILTLDELMLALREPLPSIAGFMEIVWDVDEPSYYEVNNMFGNDPEFIQEASVLKEDVNTMAETILKRQSKCPPSPGSYDLDMMSSEEILEKIRCKCKGFQDKYTKKAQLSMGSIPSDDKRTVTTGEPDQLALPKIGACCKDFLNVKDYAITFIDDLLVEAEEKVNVQPYSFSMERPTYGEDVDLGPIQSEASIELLTTDLVSWVSYLLIQDFTPSGGKELILHIINHTWNLKKKWSFCINFIVENSNTCSNFYIYEVLWSLPTLSYPIPQATVSVYFTIEVSRVKPKDCPVNLTYHFETERYKFTIDDDIQHEHFLDNILKCKLDFFKSCRM